LIVTKNSALAKDLPTGKSALANLPRLPRAQKVESGAVSVTITAETVNLRFSTGVASGDYLFRGDVVVVEWTGDGYGTIIIPSKYTGLKVWRGCTSDTGDLGCEAK
jgi:hypothetical protein